MSKRSDIDRLDNEVFGDKRYSPYGMQRMGRGLVQRVKAIENVIGEYTNLAKDILATKKQLKDSNHALRHRIHDLEEHLNAHGEMIVHVGEALDLIADKVGVKIEVAEPVEAHLVLVDKPEEKKAK